MSTNPEAVDPTAAPAAPSPAGDEADQRAEVLQAAAALVAAFGAHRTADYFAAFAPEATFVFHDAPAPLPDRAAYEAEWAAWEADGFRVQGCETSDTAVQLVAPGVAVLTHAVRTTLAGAEAPTAERETIVFRREDDGRWLAVHEHLSTAPTA
ncbi:nuclear transport factor 2 family protein [Patulibacter americanus]|uniref:nuclear transport factor 2 family protein n=1 Tax=Patulibacter americanus TaxID=588672 RepID=UPI0003B6B141|nr:nuclear transport factor 2 family protein [Patulibacter americanus]